jgi:hypothetical protein
MFVFYYLSILNYLASFVKCRELQGENDIFHNPPISFLVSAIQKLGQILVLMIPKFINYPATSIKI